MDWTTLSINKFNQIKELVLDPEYSEEDRLLYEIQILFDVDPFKLSMSQLNYFTKQMVFLSKPIPKMKVKEKYKLGYNTYILDKRLSSFTVAQWIDWRHLITDGGTDTENYANLMSVFLIPEGKSEYNEGYDIEEVKKDIGNYMSIADAMAISAFFLNYQKALLIRSLLYSRRMTLKTKLPREQRKKVRKEYRRALIAVITGR